ncbi:Hypothetical predicted protein [Marmota monax]|uniref:Uncharacterized protein n=1 Tax=Marmota monax TaxID=9995 RepID=A0A5E4A2P3_MARMO|nr:Hypothetical predicted protein [Marmota monax]
MPATAPGSGDTEETLATLLHGLDSKSQRCATSSWKPPGLCRWCEGCGHLVYQLDEMVTEDKTPTPDRHCHSGPRGRDCPYWNFLASLDLMTTRLLERAVLPVRGLGTWCPGLGKQALWPRHPQHRTPGASVPASA